MEGKPIPSEQFVTALAALKPHIEQILSEGFKPSFFDILTAVAFSYFSKQGVDAAVVEVGIGGRLDSTNVVRSAVSLVTTLGLDHTEWLGDSIEKIAAEKAGIIRRGIPLISHPQEELAWSVVEKACRENGSPVEVVGREIQLEEQCPQRARSRFNVITLEGRLRDLELAMLGAHQRLNAAAAVRAAELFARTRSRSLNEAVVREALSRAFIPARIEVVRQAPTIVVDGAHNSISIRTLLATLRDAFPLRRLFLVFGCAADKDAEAIFREAAGQVDHWYFTRNPTPRAADPEALASLLSWVNGGQSSAEIYMDPSQALAASLRAARPDDLVCCTGSFILAGALRDILVPASL